MCITIPIESKTTERNKIVDTPVLLDTGAAGNFMNKSYAQQHDILLYKLPRPIVPRNVDGSLNQSGKITHYTWIRTKLLGRTILSRLLVTNIGAQDIIFGLPWFQEHNPTINWRTGKITFDQDIAQESLHYHLTNEERKKETSNLPMTTIRHLTTEKQRNKRK